MPNNIPMSIHCVPAKFKISILTTKSTAAKITAMIESTTKMSDLFCMFIKTPHLLAVRPYPDFFIFYLNNTIKMGYSKTIIAFRPWVIFSGLPGKSWMALYKTSTL